MKLNYANFCNLTVMQIWAAHCQAKSNGQWIEQSWHVLAHPKQPSTQSTL